MRTSLIALVACLCPALLAKAAVGAETANTRFMEYPGVVALSEESGKWIYKSFPAFLPLYVFEGDPPGKSKCDRVCIAVWPILQASDHDTSKGYWTIITRDDGLKQWAYKNHPVYTFYDDTPNTPKGVGKPENWYFDESSPGSVSQKIAATGRDPRPTWRLLEP